MVRKSTAKKRTQNVARASVSFPESVYVELEELAEAKRASVAWVVREAAAKYIAGERAPLNKGEQDRD
jgi:metal-responsive CopG/Arc/MetJ family transcriptional regulator